MNHEIAKEWSARLRSGKYQRGTGALRVGDSYCCLGVLCEMAVEAGVIGPPWDDGDGIAMFDHSNAALSQTVAAWSGMGSPTGVLARGGSLAGINDSGGATFTEIADIIDANVEAL